MEYRPSANKQAIFTTASGWKGEALGGSDSGSMDPVVGCSAPSTAYGFAWSRQDVMAHDCLVFRQ